MCVGAGLSISGNSLVRDVRNPLISPDILGVSAAAGFGAALAILFSANALANCNWLPLLSEFGM